MLECNCSLNGTKLRWLVIENIWKIDGEKENGEGERFMALPPNMLGGSCFAFISVNKFEAFEDF